MNSKYFKSAEDGARREAIAQGAFELCAALSALTKKDPGRAKSHFRASRAYLGAATGKDLLTEYEHRCYNAFRVIMVLAAQPCSIEISKELDHLGWGVLDCDPRLERVVERAEELLRAGAIERDW